MNIIAVVCEYNPFHKGHLYHLQETRKACATDYIICVMSGSWVQRGEPAMVDKWSRAHMALLHGADLVLEMPAGYAVSAAKDFAKGSIELLQALGVCTHLSFGSELPLASLQKQLDAQEDTGSIQAALARGESYPRAVYTSASSALRLPNATLGIEYLRALQAGDGTIQPVVIHRSTQHNAQDMHDLASASAIRTATRSLQPFAHALPEEAYGIYTAALAQQGGGADLSLLSPLALHKLRSAQKDRYQDLSIMAEGLDQRFLQKANCAKNVDELLTMVKCKRYTLARIRRALAHVLLDFPEDLVHAKPTYARVLGFRKDKKELLGMMDQRGSIPLLSKLPRTIVDPMLQLDARAQEMWALSCPIIRPAHMDYTHSIVLC